MNVVRDTAVPPLLCEACGYPLPGETSLLPGAGAGALPGAGGILPGGACPECGLAMAESLPHHRAGPAWQRRMTPGNWLRTVFGTNRTPGILRSPRRFYRTMRIDGDNLSPRLFLASIVCLTGILTGVSSGLLFEKSVLIAWATGMLTAKALLLLTYTEALGVTFFSRQRGWRVPFHLAERIVCYASVGWVVSGVLIGLGWATVIDGGGGLRIEIVMDWVLKHEWSSWDGRMMFNSVLIAIIHVGLLLAVLLPFESLVYRGVRQCRYANAPPPGVTENRSG